MAYDSLSHTLAGVLTLLRAGGRGAPDLEARLNHAFAKHEGRLRHFCRRELRGFPPERVDEVVQDVLLEAWNKLPDYRPSARFRAFLWTIAAYKCANVRRKRADLLTDDGIVELSDGEPSPLQRLTDEERNALVERAAVAVLDVQEQEIAYLRWVLDYPLETIAELLGLDGANTVRVALQRCKRRMQKELARQLEEHALGMSFLAPSEE
ncbi:MAG: sigma-70 family RNA polymerase sigma factor [Myxococcota bacterium]